jgi:predicted secreted protein
MARLVGKAGSVSIAASTVAGIKSWGINYTVGLLDATAFDSVGEKEYVAGATDWSGTFEGYKDGAPLTPGSSVACIFKESATEGQNWAGQAIITGISVGTPFDGLVTYAYTFQGTGTLTFATA